MQRSVFLAALTTSFLIWQGKAPGQAAPSGPPKLQALIITTFARGTEWAATGAVTLPIPSEMAAQ